MRLKGKFARCYRNLSSTCLFICRRRREEQHRSTSGRCVCSRRDVRSRHRKRLWRKCHGGVWSRDRYHPQLPTWSSRLSVHDYQRFDTFQLARFRILLHIRLFHVGIVLPFMRRMFLVPINVFSHYWTDCVHIVTCWSPLQVYQNAAFTNFTHFFIISSHFNQHNMNEWMNEWKCNDLKCVRKPTKSRLSLTHHANKSSRWAE